MVINQTLRHTKNGQYNKNQNCKLSMPFTSRNHRVHDNLRGEQCDSNGIYALKKYIFET